MKAEIMDKVSMGTKLRYGVADFGIAILQSTIQFFMLFYLTSSQNQPRYSPTAPARGGEGAVRICFLQRCRLRPPSGCFSRCRRV